MNYPKSNKKGKYKQIQVHNYIPTKLQYDRKYVNFPNFQVGTQVLKKDFRRKRRLGGKFYFKWLGLYTIEANLGKGLFKLRSITNPQEIVSRVNGVHIKPYLQTTKVCMRCMHLH